MARPIKPPRGIFIPTSVVFHPDLPPGVKDTLIQLMALAWGSKHEHVTPPLSFSLLAELTGKSVRTLYGHLAELRDLYGALRLLRTGDGTFRVCLADRLYTPRGLARKPREPRCENLQPPVKEEESVNRILDLEERNDSILLPDDPQEVSQDFAKTPGSGSAMENLPANLIEDIPEGLSEELAKQLLSAGLFPGLLAEVARSGRSEDELRALAAWCGEDQPDTPMRLFMGRLRARAIPPRKYFQPPCHRCGQYGGHAPNCPRRYLSGDYAAYLEH